MWWGYTATLKLICSNCVCQTSKTPHYAFNKNFLGGFELPLYPSPFRVQEPFKPSEYIVTCIFSHSDKSLLEKCTPGVVGWWLYFYHQDGMMQDAFWRILAILSRVCALFGVLFIGPNSVVVYQN